MEPSIQIQSCLTASDPLGDQAIAASIDDGDVNASSFPEHQPVPLNENLDHDIYAGTVDLDPYFDYTSFARPWNYQSEHTVDWFSSQFFDALRETDLACSPPLQTWGSSTGYDSLRASMPHVSHRSNSTLPFDHFLDQGASLRSNSSEAVRTPGDTIQPNEDAETSAAGQNPRIASPPNETSHEDRLPFAWDPRSRPVARAKPIVLPPGDPIYTTINPSITITTATLSRIRDFLSPKERLGVEDNFTLPELSLVNVFINLFFNAFLPQAPVLHRPTLDMEDLPSELLAIMMVIGSCYSRLRHTRRFGIIVLDRIRLNLLALIEADNSLMREPHIIYASALVCYMGLWCGNKRAFELSEALRAVVVTYVRRMPAMGSHADNATYYGYQHMSFEYTAETLCPKSPRTLNSDWMEWTKKESRKRLSWFVYMVDAQFPVLLGMGGMLTMADIKKWECPCDEEFWTLATPKSWKNRLGSASEPACPVFGYLAAPLLSARYRCATEEQALLPRLNTWSSHLLLLSIIADVFHHQDALALLRTYNESEACSPGSFRTDDDGTRLFHTLELWRKCYQERYHIRHDAEPQRGGHSSTIAYHLARLYLVFPISEIQDCLGRSGPLDAKAAMCRLMSWTLQHPKKTIQAIEDASTCIGVIMSNEGADDPYDIIGLFLCHVILWSFARATSPDQRLHIVQYLREKENMSRSLVEVIEAGFSLDDTNAPKLIFRHAIQSLVQLGTWGCSSNLALLLHLHPGVSKQSS
ncbi:hypothetical protein AA0121_g11880 [Alternaria tenuissima]|nr:hypothetical protein AA0121_g11880 [Alternaria tenuissima]